MLTLHCARHGGPVLLDIGRITHVANLGGRVIVVEAVCWCGARITAVTGAGSRLPAAVVRGEGHLSTAAAGAGASLNP